MIMAIRSRLKKNPPSPTSTVTEINCGAKSIAKAAIAVTSVPTAAPNRQ